MDEATAWLLLRCLVALGDEGIGPDDEQPGDDALWDQAARLAGGKIQDYNRWVFEDGREPGWWRS